MEPFKKDFHCNCDTFDNSKGFGNLTRVHNVDHISQSWPNPNQNLDSPDREGWHPILSNILFERPLFLNDGIGFASWRRGSTCIKNIRVGASAFIAISNSAVKMEFGLKRAALWHRQLLISSIICKVHRYFMFVGFFHITFSILFLLCPHRRGQCSNDDSPAPGFCPQGVNGDD